jgi:hypothetical protein
LSPPVPTTSKAGPSSLGAGAASFKTASAAAATSTGVSNPQREEQGPGLRRAQLSVHQPLKNDQRAKIHAEPRIAKKYRIKSRIYFCRLA